MNIGSVFKVVYMSNPVASMIFCCRNIDKVEYDDKIGRFPVAIAQANNVFQAVQELDNVVGKKAKNASAILSDFAKEEKLVAAAGKGVQFLSKNVNPLICVSAGLDVFNSKDKEKSLLTNGYALGTMFVVEDLMKHNLDKIPKMKSMEKISESVMKFAKSHKCEKGLPAVVHGVAFVIGSCMAYSLGEKLGNEVATDLKGGEANTGIA